MNSNLSIGGTNSTFFLTDDERRKTVGLFITLGTAGIIINVIPIFLTVYAKKLRENTVNLFIANISVTELLMSLAFAVLQNIYILNEDRMPYLYCRWMGFYNVAVGFLAISLPPLLSINRYISLYYDDLYDRVYTKRNVCLMMLGTWLFSCTAAGTFHFTGHTGVDADNLHCCLNVNDSVGWTIYYCLVILIPFVGMGNGTLVFCNWKIYKRLTDHAALKNISANVVKQHREILYLTAIEMVMPLCFHGPYLLAKLLYVGRQNFTWRMYFASLFVSNSLFRSLVILAVLKPYKREFKKLFGCKSGGGNDGGGVTSTVAQINPPITGARS